jgi:hypothetical protein
MRKESATPVGRYEMRRQPSIFSGVSGKEQREGSPRTRSNQKKSPREQQLSSGVEADK